MSEMAISTGLEWVFILGIVGVLAAAVALVVLIVLAIVRRVDAQQPRRHS